MNLEIYTTLNPLIATFAAIAAAFAAWKAYTISRDSRSSEIYKIFLELMLKLDYSKRNDDDYLNNYWYGRVCDFFEYVCKEVSSGRLRSGDTDMFKVVMKQDDYIEYAKKRNKESRESFKTYLNWLENDEGKSTWYNFYTMIKRVKSHKYLLVLLILVAISFYWFQWRPTQIRSNCGDFTRQKAIENKVTYNNMGVFFDTIYANCLNREGLAR